MKLYLSAPAFFLVGWVTLSPPQTAGAGLAPVDGSISFGGGASLNGPLDTATLLTSFFGPGGSNRPVVLNDSGDFVSVPDGPVTAIHSTPVLVRPPLCGVPA